MSKENMTPKERVMAAVKLEKPDRVPIDPALTNHGAAHLTGRSQASVHMDPDVALDAFLDVFDTFGGWDMFEYPVPCMPVRWGYRAGLSAKLPGRVSDSALVGAGTWADDATCAVSATGHGEYFIRATFARAVDGELRHTGCDLETACARALAQVSALGGKGGCIAVDHAGRVALPFDTPSMPRGVVRAGGDAQVALHHDETVG